MKRFVAFFSLFVLAFTFVGNVGAQQRNEREIRDVVRSLNSKVDDFKYNLEYQMRSSSADRGLTTDMSTGLRTLLNKISVFETNFRAKRENKTDIQAIITAAQTVDELFSVGSYDSKLVSDWGSIQDLIDQLANNYNVTPDWSGSASNTDSDYDNSPPPVQTTNSYSSNKLNGTFRLDVSRSEKTSDILANSRVGAGNRKDLEDKLAAPEQIALDISRNRVVLASTTTSPVQFIADGRDKTEEANGRTINVRATLSTDKLVVSSRGGETDYTITFVSIDAGEAIKVTRRITTDYLTETIFADSIYTKADAVARLGIDTGDFGQDTGDDSGYSSNDPNDGNNTYGNPPRVQLPRLGAYTVANGTTISGILENEIDTKVSQNNDRFKLTVQSPDEYRGAVIEGYLTGIGRSSQVSGRSNITFNFDRITLRDGKQYDFAGTLASIKDVNGKDVKIDNEGTAKGKSQTKETIKRGGIGAGIGAIIGAIAGGGNGAAIGAIIGGGAGAGSVAIQGRGDLQLQKGTTLTITASAPTR